MFQINKTNIVLDNKTKEAKKKAEAVLSELSSAIDSLVEAKNNHEKDVKKLNDLSNDITELSVEKDGFISEIENLSKDKLNLLWEKNLVNEDINKLNILKESLLSEVSSLDNSIKDKGNAISWLNFKIETLEDELEWAEATKYRIENEILELESKKESMEDWMEELMKWFDELKRMTESREKEIKRLDSELSARSNQKLYLENEITSLIKKTEVENSKWNSIVSNAKIEATSIINEAKKDKDSIIRDARKEAQDEIDSISVMFKKLKDSEEKFKKESAIIDWELSEKKKWVNEKEVRLREIKNKLESFYWKKIDNIII